MVQPATSQTSDPELVVLVTGSNGMVGHGIKQVVQSLVDVNIDD